MLFLCLTTWRLYPPRNQEAKDDNGSRTFRNEMWPVVQFNFSNIVKFSAVPVAFWIPSSASMPQVGFMWRKASPTREETSKFQIRRRRNMEVPCSEVPLRSLARFCDGCRLWEINSTVRNQRMNRIEQVLLSWQYLQNFSE